MALQMNGLNALFNNAMLSIMANLPIQSGNINLPETALELPNSDSIALSDKGAAAAADAGPVVSTEDDDAAAAKDADAAGDAKAAKDKKDPEQIKRDAFDKNFTREKVANLLGKQPEDLDDTQSKNLNDLLYGINEENAKREAEGKDPMTREEVNDYLAKAVDKYKDDMENDPDSLGKTISELGLEDGLDGILLSQLMTL